MLQQSTGASTLYFRSTYAAGEVFQGTTPPGISDTPLWRFRLQEYVYYIGMAVKTAPIPPCRRCAALPACNKNGAMVRMNWCERRYEQIHGCNMAATPTTNLTPQYSAGDAPDFTGASDLLQPSNGWDNVNSVRVWLLAAQCPTQ